MYITTFFVTMQIENNFLKIYDGGSEKDSLLNVFTGNTTIGNPLLNALAGNTLNSATLSTGNQILISYTNNRGEAPGKGFSASLTFGKKVTNFSFSIIGNFFLF